MEIFKICNVHYFNETTICKLYNCLNKISKLMRLKELTHKNKSIT